MHKIKFEDRRFDITSPFGNRYQNNVLHLFFLAIDFPLSLISCSFFAFFSGASEVWGTNISQLSHRVKF